jgi:hypothetical protein
LERSARRRILPLTLRAPRPIHNFLIRAPVATALGLVTTIACALALSALREWHPQEAIFHYLTPRGSAISNIEVWQVRQAGMIRRVVGAYGTELWGGNAQNYLPSGIYDSRVGDDSEYDTSWGALRDAIVSGKPDVAAIDKAAGWPMLALACTTELKESATGLKYEVRGGIPIPREEEDSWREPNVLPFAPLWSGLIGDTAIFAVIWAVVIGVPPACRGSYRRRRGLCPTCAYDLRHDLATGCPECGWNRPQAASPPVPAAAPCAH